MKCLIADDHALIRDGVKQLLSKEFSGAEIFEAANGKEIQSIVKQHTDLSFILLDYYLPGTDSHLLMQELCNEYPGVAVIIFSGSENPGLMRKTLDAGASGFIPKSSSNDMMVQAIRLILSGGVYIPPSMLIQHGHQVTSGDQAQYYEMSNSIHWNQRRPNPTLTERQLEVLKLIALGKTNREIAEQLKLSANTIKVHVTSILQVLQTTNRTEAVIAAQKTGLFSGNTSVNAD